MILTISEKLLEVSAAEYLQATLQTIYMSTVALLIALVFGSVWNWDWSVTSGYPSRRNTK